MDHNTLGLSKLMATPDLGRHDLHEVYTIHTLMIEFSNLAAHCLKEPVAAVYRVLAALPRQQMIDHVSTFGGWEKLMWAFATEAGVPYEIIAQRAAAYIGHGLSMDDISGAETEPVNEPRYRGSFRSVANGFNIDPVRIKHERAIIIGMIIWPKSRCAVVFSACREGRFKKRINFGARRCRKGNMRTRPARAAIAQPEEWLPGSTVAYAMIPASLLRSNLHDRRDIQSR